MIASPDNRSVAGVRFEDVRGTSGTLSADLVVDASGRISLTQGFLEAIGSPKPPTAEIGMDQAYSTLVFEKPKDAPTDWLAMIHAPAPPQSSRHGVIFPMEGGRWSVSLAEDHKAPPGDVDGFMEFVASFRTPTIHNAIRGARPNRRCCPVQDAVQRALRLRPARPIPPWVDPARQLGLPFPSDLRPGNERRGPGMLSCSRACIESRRWRADPLDGLAEAFLARDPAASRNAVVARDGRTRSS